MRATRPSKLDELCEDLSSVRLLVLRDGCSALYRVNELLTAKFSVLNERNFALPGWYSGLSIARWSRRRLLFRCCASGSAATNNRSCSIKSECSLVSGQETEHETAEM